MEPLDISNIRDEHERNMRCSDEFIEDVLNNELFDLIDQNLSVEFRADYLRIRDGAYVPKPRREQIMLEIKKIIGEEPYEEG